MRKSGRAAAWAASSAFVLALCSTTASAQLSNKPEAHYTITPYLWLTGLNGTVGVGRVESKVDLSAGDVLDMLEFGIMGSAEARKGPWMMAFDGIYAKLGAGRVVAIRGDTGAFDLTQHETIIQTMGGYTIAQETWAVDFMGGFRYWNLSTSLDVDRTRRPSNERSGSRQWVDATGGARLRWIPYEKVRFVLGGDAGGGGSRDTWQAYSTLGYDFWRKWTLGVGYRVLGVDYDHDNFVFDTRTKGFLLGATYRFR